jgi:phenylacetate-CoA ligase
MANRFAAFRKELPLPLRRCYGWARRQVFQHPVWDDEEFQRWYGWLLESQWRSKKQIEADQFSQLCQLISHAYQNVPYYRRVFDERKLKPADVRSLDDLGKIPILTRASIRENLDDLIARNYDRGELRFKTTSGSTGAPLGLYDEGTKSALHEAAFRYRQWSWAGYRFGDRMASLRYAVSRADRLGRNVVWDFKAGDNELQLSPFGMDEERMAQYVELLREFEPRFINAMPSCLEILARFSRRNRILLPEVEAIFCESENMYPWQRALFEEQFQGRVFAAYGHSERCVDAVECEQHDGYDVSMEYGILELVDQQGEPVTQAGQTGRVVGTGFDTYAMPLVRYATDDLAMFAQGRCSCGREGIKLQEIKGRIGEYVVSRTGNLMSLPAIYSVIHSPVMAQVRELRFTQERAGEIELQIVPVSKEPSSRLERELLAEIYNRIDEHDLAVRIRFLENLPRKRAGKAGLLEQKLQVTFEDIAS